MKNLFFALIATMFLTAANAQRFQTDFSYSTKKQAGFNVYHVGQKGFTIGVGGSYMFSTYTGETGSKFQELANVSLGNDGSKWSNAFRTNYSVNSFKENRGTVKLLIGKTVKNTSVMVSTGIAFRSEYWRGKGYDFLPEFTSPERNFYVYRNIAPSFLYGINVAHLISNRTGVNIGYDNFSGLTAGITFNLKGSGLFEY